MIWATQCLVVEHDDETIRASDWIVDLGPGAGEHGGEVVAEGPLDVILHHPTSLTGAYLSGRRCVPVPETQAKRQWRSAGYPRCAPAQFEEHRCQIAFGSFHLRHGRFWFWEKLLDGGDALPAYGAVVVKCA